VRDIDQLVAIGRLTRSHGLRGELVVEPLTDHPERFQRLRRVYAVGRDKQCRELVVERCREHQGRPLLKFEGVDGIDAARALAGREIRLPEHELMPLPEGAFYAYRMVGLTVWTAGERFLGRVEAVMQTGGPDLLVVRDQRGDEVLVPLSEEICRVDLEARRIDLDPPEGLLTLNAS
jgi:16S rRNA processing protein RimM